ncbi:MAG: site-specific DNA-methyltransferase [Treponema sp.]|nr:site-specific DNA-methyltransferase [Treponema sp.]
MPPEQREFQFEPVKGIPCFNWKGKRPYTSTQYFPAQSRERIGEEQDGWINRLYWGDNLQVMSHLLKEFRGKIDLVYIDPPFDSKADYKKNIETRGRKAGGNFSVFEDVQYKDIWPNDEYLQFMYERLILMRELLSDSGSIYLHCDWHKSHHLRMIMDEVFGPDNFTNEIVWQYKTGGASKDSWAKKHDTLLMFAKNYGRHVFNLQKERSYMMHKYGFQKSDFKIDEDTGCQYSMVFCRDVWDFPSVGSATGERLDYPTQKPEILLERIIRASSNPGGLVFDCFMGSGTAQAAAMKSGRRFIGADINPGAMQTTMRRLLKIKKELDAVLETGEKKYTSFKIFNVNSHDLFNNPVQAKDLLIEYFGMQRHNSSSPYDGSKDGRMWKIMPVNRIASRADICAFAANLPYSKFESMKKKNPHEAVEKFTLVCMGHEPGLKAELEKQLSGYKIDVEIVDILRNEAVLALKRKAEADIRREGNKLVIKKFCPMNLMKKMNLKRISVTGWKELVDSVRIDFNYDRLEMQPSVIDSPDKNELVKGEYEIPKNAGRILIRITDLISETFETELS